MHCLGVNPRTLQCLSLFNNSVDIISNNIESKSYQSSNCNPSIVIICVKIRVNWLLIYKICTKLFPVALIVRLALVMIGGTDYAIFTEFSSLIALHMVYFITFSYSTMI